MVYREHGNNEGFYGLMLWWCCALERSGKENYSDFSKVCYPVYIRTVDRVPLRGRLNFAKEAMGPRM